MAQEFSFDVVSVLDMQELDNAVNQAMKEISQRFDFRGSKSQILLDKEKKTIVLSSDDEARLKSVTDILQTKLIKRGVSLKALVYGKIEPALNTTVRQTISLQQGISQDKAKDINRAIKDSGLKVRSQIQGEQIRVIGKSKDELQKIMDILREKDLGVPLQFVNYR